MKGWRIITVLLLCLILVGLVACSSVSVAEQETSKQLIKKGDSIVTVSGSGNIEVSNEMKLTFGVAGKVDKIYVEEGDEVNEGDVLAELKTDTLELALTEAKVAKKKAEVDVTQAQIALQTTEYNLEIARDLYTWSDIKIAQADVDEAKEYLEYSLEQLIKYIPPDRDGQYPDTLEYVLGEDFPKPPGYEIWQERIVHAQSRLNAAKERLNAMLSGYDIKEIAIKKLEIEAGKESLELAKQSQQLVQQSLELAQKQLDEATITAPFDGLVARVNVDEGDTVSTAIIIVHLIDPNSMELNIEVDEIDIPGVRLGQGAIIEIDALSNLPLEGKVSSISLLPIIETGLIMYDVKIKFDIPEGVVLRAGMSANADIIIAK